MSTAKLRPFKLEEFKSNEETPVLNEVGEKVEVHLRKRCPSQFPVIACSHGDWSAHTYTNDGRQLPGEPVTLFFAPRKKVVPLSLEDIKTGMAFRIKGESAIQFINAACKAHIVVALAGSVTYKQLQQDYEYSFDCLTWHRCEKEVEV